MTMVLHPDQSADDLVAADNESCPACGGRLRYWGWARWREVRGSDAGWRFRPRRVRCSACGMTQVVLPSDVLVRRRDSVVVVGRAWRAFAGGAGGRVVARALGLPMETVRGWLRRLCLLASASPSLARPSPDPDRGSSRAAAVGNLGRVLATLEGEADRHGARQEADIWRFMAYRSQGRLLSNTSWL